MWARRLHRALLLREAGDRSTLETNYARASSECCDRGAGYTAEGETPTKQIPQSVVA